MIAIRHRGAAAGGHHSGAAGSLILVGHEHCGEVDVSVWLVISFEHFI